MGQLSFFSADFATPQLDDLGGLLAGPGQVTLSPGQARVSILLSAQWRAEALVAECAERGISARVLPAADPVPYLLQTQKNPQLRGLATAWTSGAVKSVPDALSMTPGLLRCWAISVGRMDEAGYLLGLDPHAPDTYEPLLHACAKVGLAGSLIGHRGGGPGVRIVGRRRLTRLVEYLGTLPPAGPIGAFPVSDY